eukprot:gene6323-10330_t
MKREEEIFFRDKKKFFLNDFEKEGEVILNLKKNETLSKEEIFRLSQLLNEKEEKKEKEKKEIKILNRTKEIYENEIDPIWYLKNGPLIIFPSEMKLTIKDYVEYYRAYPKLNWSKYPKLLENIKLNLTKDEQKKLKEFETYQKKKYSKEDHFKDLKSTWNFLKKFFNLSIFRYFWKIISFIFKEVN